MMIWFKQSAQYIEIWMIPYLNEKMWTCIYMGMYFCVQAVGFSYYSDVTWVSWLVKSSATRKFVQHFVQTIKETKKVLHYRFFERGFPLQRASNAKSDSISWRHDVQSSLDYSADKWFVTRKCSWYKRISPTKQVLNHWGWVTHKCAI